MAQLLIDRGADIGALGGNNGARTALQQAATSGSKSIVTLLIKNGASVNEPAGRYGGFTALQVCIQQTAFRCLPYLK